MEKSGDPRTQILVALIAAIAVIIGAYITLQAAKAPVLLTIGATQTAEARRVESLIGTPTLFSNQVVPPPIIITVVVTATPAPFQSSPNSDVAQSEEKWIAQIPGVLFSPNTYFIFSIFVGLFIHVLFINIVRNNPLSLSWLIYLILVGYYNYHLFTYIKVSFYQALLSVLITIGLGVLKFINPTKTLEFRFFDYVFLILLLLPLSIAIGVAGWQQIDLLTYVPKVFPWNISICCILLLIMFF